MCRYKPEVIENCEATAHQFRVIQFKFTLLILAGLDKHRECVGVLRGVCGALRPNVCLALCYLLLHEIQNFFVCLVKFSEPEYIITNYLISLYIDKKKSSG